MYNYLYINNEDKIQIINNCIEGLNSLIYMIKKDKDLILSGGNSQRSIQGIDFQTEEIKNSISALNAKKNQLT